MEFEQAQELIRDSLRNLLVNDHDLCTSDAHERSITSHLFRYIADHPSIPAGINVDHEYNRMGGEYTKYLGVQLRREVEWDALEDPVDRNILPDVLVHGRGDHHSNLIALEAKVGRWCSEIDEAKIRALMAVPFLYANGLLLALMRDNDGSGRHWRPFWLWNPTADEPVEYVEVFDHGELVDLVDRGRMMVEERRTMRQA